jgi:thiamine biosynthesis lipoprotein
MPTQGDSTQGDLRSLAVELSGAAVQSIGNVRRLRPLFGSFCAIEAVGSEASSTAGVHHAVERAFHVMADIEHRMHPTRVGSDLRAIATSPHVAVVIGDATWRVLALAKDISKFSNGVFDPCLPSQPGKLSDVELLENSVAICRVPIAIDLGGIAKGFAVDQAIEALRDDGCISGLVNAGGDVRVFGKEAQHFFLRARDRDPLEIELRDAALAATEVGAADATPEHRGYYTRSGDRPIARRCAAVIANSAAIADALTKCVLFCTSDELEAILRRYNATLLPLQ